MHRGVIALASGCPLKLFLMCGAIAQIEIDQVLVGHPGFLGQALEVADGVLVQAYGDLPLEHLGVWVFDPF